MCCKIYLMHLYSPPKRKASINELAWHMSHLHKYAKNNVCHMVLQIIENQNPKDLNPLQA